METVGDGVLNAVALWRLPGTSLAGAPDALPTAAGLLQAVVGAAWAAQLAEAGVPLRLETTNPVNVPFYEAHGLQVRSEVRLGPSGPTMWALET